ncbi:MAG TPA: hypothetical protein PK185_17655 [Cyclobacteriaceae bacterium]|nr:hypothetical protein [Cyclobacteriaceae bacterium]
MISILFVALVARIVLITAFKLDGNHITCGVIMGASSLLINHFAPNFYFHRTL